MTDFCSLAGAGPIPGPAARLSNETFWDLASTVDAEKTVYALHSHGLGWLPYSYPHISPPGKDEEILPGHAFTLEVKARVRDIGHFKCEDTFVMHQDGAECLNRLERKLFVQ
jgi:Xaa-Pro aminopeptidase